MGQDQMTEPRAVIITDSSASLPAAVLEHEQIVAVPISVVFDGDVYSDGSLSPAEFYQRLEETRGRPTTSSPSPGEFIEAFRKACDDGAAAVLCLTMSARLSGTHRVAETAAEICREELPGFPIRVVDTGGLAMTHGFAVLAAARALAAGATIDEAAEAATRVGSQGELVGALQTMRYLAKGGRVPWIVHWAAAALQIKPVLAWSNGDVRAVARVRTMDRALDRVVEYVANHAGSRDLRIAVMHASAPAFAELLAERIRECIGSGDVMITEFTTGMGVHTGPGFAGVAFYSE
jgi:DegV family protein with EDD domain